MKPMNHYEHLEQAISDLKAENERLRLALEDLLAYSTGGKWGHDESPDEFIRAALKGE
jgi:hypothetical protein